MLRNTDEKINKKLPCEFIRISTEHIRQIIDDSDIESLSGLVRDNRYIKSISVNYVNDKCYILTAGLRRFLAVKKIGLAKIPCNVSCSDVESEQKKAIIDQLSCKGLHYLDQANAFKKLFDLGFKVEQIASMVGLAENTVYNITRITKIPKEYKDIALKEGLPKSFMVSLVPKSSDKEKLKEAIENELGLRGQTVDKKLIESLSRYIGLSHYSAKQLSKHKISSSDLKPLYYLSLKISGEIREHLKRNSDIHELAEIRDHEMGYLGSFPIHSSSFKIANKIIGQIDKNSRIRDLNLVNRIEKC